MKWGVRALALLLGVTVAAHVGAWLRFDVGYTWPAIVPLASMAGIVTFGLAMVAWLAWTRG